MTFGLSHWKRGGFIFVSVTCKITGFHWHKIVGSGLFTAFGLNAVF